MAQPLQKLPPVIALVGPTGSGKSALAVKIARKINGELISADSRQIYRGLNIATAKLRPPQGIKQWLIDVVPPDKTFTLFDYQQLAFRIIKDIHRRQKIPIIVGGTGLYVDAVIENWQLPKDSFNVKLRKKIENDLKKKGLGYLVKRLRTLNPSTVRRIDCQNPRRVIRALELALQGKSIVPAQRGNPKYDRLVIGLKIAPEKLKIRLQQRAKQMIRRGLVAETKKLYKKYSPTLPALSGIGYAEAAKFSAGKISKDELISAIEKRSRSYAKRQMTWFKRNPEIIWANDPQKILRLCVNWLKARRS